MASNSENSFYKNADSLLELINLAVSWGTTYAPSSPNLSVGSLQTLHSDYVSFLGSVNSAQTTYVNQVNDRKNLFKGLSSKAVRIVAILKSSGASQDLIDDAQTIVRKLRGSRKRNNGNATETPTTPDSSNPPLPNSFSVSQRSYANQQGFFLELINLVASFPAYSPSEAEFQTANLNVFASNLADANESVINKYYLLFNARTNRNEFLHNPSTGLLVTAVNVKAYIKGLFGFKSPQYKAATAIKFSKRKK